MLSHQRIPGIYATIRVIFKFLWLHERFFRDLPPSLSIDSVFLVANASSVLFIIYQVCAQVMASSVTPECALDSLGILVEFATPPFVAVLVIPVSVFCVEVPQNPPVPVCFSFLTDTVFS